MRNQLLFAATAAFAAAPALAQQVTATDPQTVVQALSASGYQAQLTKDNSGDPMIRSSSSGSGFLIYFYNCTSGAACATVQFHASYDTTTESAPSLETINKWNREQRFGRAYLDAQGDPAIEMDVDLDDGGMSQELFIDNLEFWVVVMARFEETIGW